MWLFILLFVVVVLVFFYILFPYQIPSNEIVEALGSLPGPKGFPFFGSIEIFNIPSHCEYTYRLLVNKLLISFTNRYLVRAVNIVLRPNYQVYSNTAVGNRYRWFVA